MIEVNALAFANRPVFGKWNSYSTQGEQSKLLVLKQESLKVMEEETNYEGDSHLKFNVRSHTSTLQIQMKFLISWLKTRLKIKSLVLSAGISKPANSKDDSILETEPKANPRREALLSKVFKQVSEDVDFDNLEKEVRTKSNLMGILQIYAECPDRHPQSMQKLQSFVADNLATLAYCKLGAHLIRTLLSQSKGFTSIVKRYTKKHFKEMALDDFACRVLRAVMRQSESFRQKAVLNLQHDLDYCLTHFPSIFILTEAIRMSDHVQEFDFLIDALEADPVRHLMSRYFKRILVTLVEFCDAHQLKRIEVAMDLDSNFSKYLNDKFCTTILTFMMSRGSQRSFDVLLCLALSKPVQLLTTSKFNYFIMRLIALLPEKHIGALHDILQIIRQGLDESRYYSRESLTESLFLGYSLLLTYKMRRKSNLAELTELLAWTGNIVKTVKNDY